MGYIDVEAVWKIYRTGSSEVYALKGVSLSLGKGDLTCILGPNGSGKTTLLKVIAGYIKPDSGSVYIDGIEITRLDWDRLAEFRRGRIGFIFQEDIMINTLSVYENLDLGLKPYIRDSLERKRIISRTLERFGIKYLSNRLYGRLSEGEKKKVMIAWAVSTSPEILLADEPTSHLDEDGVKEVINIINRLNREGATILVATHDPLVAEMIGKKIYMRGGRIVSKSGF